VSARHWLLQRAEQTPHAPALESSGAVWTFAELADRARRGAAYVLGTLPGGDAPLALLLPGGADFAAWFHAVALAGRTVLPLNTRLTCGELVQQLTDARVSWLLGEGGDARLDELARQVPGLRTWVAPSLAALPGSPPSLRGETIEEGGTLAVLFTSGTTGRAKGARLSWGNFLASAGGAADRLGPTVGGRWLACMPLFHVGGLSILVRSALFGGPVRLQPRFDAAAVSDALDCGDITGLSLVPTMLSRLLEYRAGRPLPGGLRVLLLGGAPVAPDLLRRAFDAGFPVCPTYGLTEATSQVATAAPPQPHATDPSPMRPLSGIELRIVDDDRDLPPGVAGEIAVRGATVMQGYLNDAQATQRALRAGWLFTGDIGYLDATGGLHVLDRRDDLVITGGENVYPAEIEAALLEHPEVAEAGVAGVQDTDLGARVVAWVVKRPGAEMDVAALDHFCRARLAGYKRPREFRIVDALPRNAAGKLQRRRLVALRSPVTVLSPRGD
jgi:O-succinylbenzoic acid--CoA ligase